MFWKCENLLRIDTWVQDAEVLAGYFELAGEDVALFASCRLVVVAAASGGVGRDVAGDWSRGGRTRLGGRGGPGRRYILLTGCTDTDLGADGAVEVVTARIDPRIVGTELDRADFVRSRH